MKTSVASHIKYSIVERKDGMYQPQREYGDMMLFPAFDSLRDAITFMEYQADDFVSGIVGNVQIIKEKS